MSRTGYRQYPWANSLNFVWDVNLLTWVVETQPSGGGGGGAVTVADGADVNAGATTDAAITSDANGTLSGKLRGLVKILASVWDSVNGRLKVDGSGVTQPVSGTVTTSPPTNASTNVAQLAGTATSVNSGTKDAGTLRVVIATDQPQLANALKVDGSAVTQPTQEIPQSSSTNALTNATSTAYETNRVIKASAGRLYQLTGYNSRTTPQFIQLHNATSLPADTAVPVITFQVPGSQPFSLSFGEFGRYFSTGIVICNSSTGPTKTIGSADCWFDAQYL